MRRIETEVLHTLFANKEQSIAGLSLAIGKSLPVVSRAVADLLDQGLIVEDGLAPSSGGRRAAQYRLNAQKLPYIISVAVDQFSVSAGLYDLSGQLISPSDGELSSLSIDLLHEEEAAYATIVSAIDGLMQAYSSAVIIAIGVSIPGFVRLSSGENTTFAKESKFYRLAAALETQFNLPTYLDNDSVAVALAEKYFGQASHSKDFLTINLNWGVGLGMVIDDKIFRGYRGYAGEFSHIPLSNTNRVCSCGKRDCLEVEASLGAALELLHTRLESGETSSLQEQFAGIGLVSRSAFLRAIDAGDPLAIEVMAQVMDVLGKGIATLIHLFNPEYIVVGGAGAAAGEVLRTQIQHALYKYSIRKLSDYTEILVSKLPQGQLLGGLCVAVERMDWRLAVAENSINNKYINNNN